MRFLILRSSEVTSEPAMIHVEPQTDKEQETLEQLLSEFPQTVKGFGRDPETMEIIHMQLAVIGPSSHSEQTTNENPRGNDVENSTDPVEFSESLECKTFDDGAFIIADGPVNELSSCIIAARNASPTPELSCAYARLFTAAPKLLKIAEELVSAWEANEQAFDELERELIEPLYLKAKEAIQGIRQPSQ